MLGSWWPSFLHCSFLARPWIAWISVGCLLGSILALSGFVSADRALKEGMDATRKKNDTEAILLLTQAIQSGDLSDQDLGEAYHFRGIAYARTGIQEDADRDFQAAVRLQPQNGLLFYHKGNNNFRRGLEDQALSDLNTAIKFVQDPYAYALRGRIFLNRNNPGRAMEDLTTAIQLKPNEAYFFYRRGLGLSMQGNYHSAVDDFSQAIQLTPGGERDYYYGRGQAHYELDEYMLAVQDFTDAFRRNSQDVQALFGRAASYAKLGRIDKEGEDLDQVLKIDHTYAPAYFNRAVLQTRSGNYRKALTDLEKTLNYQKNLSASVYFLRGWVNFLQGHYLQAEQAFEKSLQTESKESVGEEALLWSYLVRNRLGKRGRSILSEALKNGDGDEWVLTLASFLMGAHSRERLLVDISNNQSLTAFEKQARRCAVYFWQGEVHLENSQKAEAVKNLKFAVETKAYTTGEYIAAQAELRRMHEL